MNDLVSVLKNAVVGIELASEMINCLLFTDDIVLIGKTGEELQSLLTIAGVFQIKLYWKLCYKAT
jgi:hypothetical protein